MTTDVRDPGRGEPKVTTLSMARRAMVRTMNEAALIPCFYLRNTVDVSQILANHAEHRQQDKRPPSLNDHLVSAVALTLREHPNVNASYVDGEIHLFPRINVGVAIATDTALYVPAVYDADFKTLASIGTEIQELIDRAHRRRLGREVLQAATFTVSNLGMYGVDDFDPVLNPPQAAILAVGKVHQNGRLRLCLGCDHRVLTGAEGASFLQTLRRQLEGLSPVAGNG